MVRRTLRSLARDPRFSVPAVLMLATGVALSSVSYAVLESAVWKALPYGEPSRLVLAGRGSGLHESEFLNLTLPEYELLRSRAKSFESAGYQVDTAGMVARRAGRPTLASVARISPSLLDVFQIRPAMGRSFHRGDFDPAAPDTVLLSFGLWKRLFSADPEALGQDIEIDRRRFTVIGVMPETLRRPATAAGLWIPDKSPETSFNAERMPDKRVFARLRRGISLGDAQREIANLQPAEVPGWQRSPAARDRFKVLSVADQLVGQASRIMHVLLGACLLVQLMACFNIGHLMLARRLRAGRDLGIQLALGSGTARLCREALSESLVLASAAVLLAIPLVLFSLPAAAIVTSYALGIEIRGDLSASVLIFGACLGVMSGLFCAALPVLLLRRLEVSSLLSQRWQKGALSLTASRLQETLIIVQLAMAVVLMAGFGLMAKSVYRLSRVDLGFDPDHLSYVVFGSGHSRLPALGLELDRALERLSRVPSVKSAAVASTPLLVTPGVRRKVNAKTNDGEWTNAQWVNFQAVSGGYFSTLGIPLLSGRTFDRRDVYGTPCSVLVNRSFALLFWSSLDVLNKQIDMNGGTAAPSICAVIGVVGDARTTILASPPQPEFYLSHRQKQAAGNAILLVKAHPGQHVPPDLVRRLMAEADPSREPDLATDVEALVRAAIMPGDTRATLLGGLALCALLLASAGMYAAATYDLSERTREIGIRLAMGARTADIALLVYRRYARLALAGGSLGAAAGAAVSRYAVAGLSLFQVQQLDPAVFVLAPSICAFLVLASVTMPMLRATRINASQLLRGDAL